MGNAIKPLVDAVNKLDHPALYKSLRASIKAQGQLVPIIEGQDGSIIDGRLRLRACHELKVKPKIVRFNGDAVSAWHAGNVVRRHLTLGERTLIALEMSKLRKRGDNGTTQGISQSDAARACGVSVDSIGRAKKILAKAPEMLPRIAAGKSLTGLDLEIRQVAHAKKARKFARANGSAQTSLCAMAKAGVKHAVVYADPPWDYGRGHLSVTGAVEPRAIYPTMQLEKIKSLPVKECVDTHAVCWLWVPTSLLDEGIEVLHAWGFDYTTSLVWAKTRGCPTPGAVWPTHELVLVGKRGSGLKSHGAIRQSVFTAKPSGHSRKPEWFAEQIERLYPKMSKIELFSRAPRKGWVAWGNQV